MDCPPTQLQPVRACIVLAHGSRNNNAVASHLHLCDELATRLTNMAVLPAFLELAEPTLEDAVATAVSQDVQEVRVYPHFLSPGNHVAIDIPQRLATLREKYPSVEITQLTYLGADPALVDFVLARLAQ